MPAFTRFVEVGRVALVNYGELKGKIVVITDVVDGNRCVVEGPTTGVARQVIGYGRLALTDHKVTIPRNARTKTIKAAIAKGEIEKKWSESAWATKIALKAKRASLSDFDRFKTMVAKKQKSAIVKKTLKSMK